MKKIYIEPKNTVVRLNLERIMCLSVPEGEAQKETPSEGNGGNGLAREVIQAPDAWDNEW